jgi:uncharacterized protein YhfF
MAGDEIERFWQAYLASLRADSLEHTAGYVAESLGDDPEPMDQLGALILLGVKTATCSALWEWESEGNPPPRVGQTTIVLDGQNHPLCVIETTEVTIRPFSTIDEQFAAAEGEGDRSLGFWRDVHWRYFTRTLARIGRVPVEDMPLVCERFRRIYP